MNVSFAIRMDKSVTLKNKKHPLVLQVIFNRKIRKKRLGLEASEDQWNAEDHEFRKGTHNREENNATLHKALIRAEKIERQHFNRRPFNYKKFAELFEQGEISDMKVRDFAIQVYEDKLKKGRIKSAYDYQALESAISKVPDSEIYLSEMDEQWLDDFEDYFVERGCKCFNYMKLMRALYNMAIKKRLVDFKSNPFENPLNPYGYKVGKLRKNKSKFNNNGKMEDLSENQLIQLFNYSPISEVEEKYLDIWFLSYYLFGVNFKDLALMEIKQIRENVWYYNRSKTNISLDSGKPILPEARKIIDKYYDPSKKYVLDILNGYDDDPEIMTKRISHYTGHLRKCYVRISKRLDFNGYFTIYSARYTAATRALNKGADTNSVRLLMDHTQLTTTNRYVKRGMDDLILESMELLRIG